MVKKIIYWFLICGLLGSIFFYFWEKKENKTVLPTLTLVLDWYINPDHAGIIAAQTEHFFAKNGLNIKIIAPNEAYLGEKMVALKKADLAITYQPAFLIKVTQDLPLLRVGSLVSQPLNSILLKQNGKISNIDDLKGKRFAVNSQSLQNLVLTTMLKRSQIKYDDLKIIHMNFNTIDALLVDKVDAITGAMRNFEPFILEDNGFIPVMFYPEDYGFPHYDELIIVANRDTFASKKDLIHRFLLSLREGVSFVCKNPEKAWEHFIEAYPEEDTPTNKKSYFITSQLLEKDPLTIDQQKYDTFAKFMYDSGFISYVPQFTNYVYCWH